MSCCGAKCCSSGCNCGSGCKACGSSSSMYLDVEKSATTSIIINGVAPMKASYEGLTEESFGAEGGHGCKCGPNCKCDPCNC